MTVDWLWWLQVAFILYFLLLNGMYLLLNLLSMGSLMGYIRQRAETGELAPYLGVEPPVSVLMPAFNEEATIRTSVRSMLQLQYPEFEIVVNPIIAASRSLRPSAPISRRQRCGISPGPGIGCMPTARPKWPKPSPLSSAERRRNQDTKRSRALLQDHPVCGHQNRPAAPSASDRLSRSCRQVRAADQTPSCIRRATSQVTGKATMPPATAAAMIEAAS